MPNRRAFLTAAIAALIAVAVGIALSYQIHWFPVQASTQAGETDTLYHVLVIASVPIFVLVVSVILFSVWQFHMRPGEELEDGLPIHGNTRLEVFWTAIPAALLLGLVAYSFAVLHNNEQKPAGVPEVQIGVTGQQFFWDYEYPSSVTGGKPVKSYQLYLPLGSTVYFNMNSKDVIHAFWIPAFRLQEDVVPGITTHYRATPDRLGTFPVVCNLLCGSGHSLMRSAVHVVSPARFRAWLAAQERAGTTVATASATRPGSPAAPAAVAGAGAG
jgi:cytochrome c oxidase subunit 2